jgi:hypothetical protein
MTGTDSKTTNVKQVVEAFGRLKHSRDMADALVAILSSWRKIDEASFNVVTHQCVDRHADFVELMSHLTCKVEVSTSARSRIPAPRPHTWQRQEHPGMFNTMVHTEREVMMQSAIADAYRVRLRVVHEDLKDVYAQIRQAEKVLMVGTTTLVDMEEQLKDLNARAAQLHSWRCDVEQDNIRMSSECAGVMAELDETAELFCRVKEICEGASTW